MKAFTWFRQNISLIIRFQQYNENTDNSFGDASCEPVMELQPHSNPSTIPHSDNNRHTETDGDGSRLGHSKADPYPATDSLFHPNTFRAATLSV